MKNWGKPSGAMKRRALRSSTALAVLVGVGVLSPLSMEQALADCVVNTAGTPDTIVCSGADTNGVDMTGDANESVDGVNVTINDGASLGNGAGRSLAVEVDGGGGQYTRTFNFSMEHLNSSIAGSGTQIYVEGGTHQHEGFWYATAVDGTWDINGTIQSTDEGAIDVFLRRGTGEDGIEMNIGATGKVIAADDAIVIRSLTDEMGSDWATTAGGVELNYTLNNDGLILAGGNGVSVSNSIDSTEEGEIVVNNRGIIGKDDAPIGAHAILIDSKSRVATEIEVTNDPGDNTLLGAGTIHSVDTAIEIYQNSGSTKVTNAEGGSITSEENSGIWVVTRGTAEIVNAGSIESKATTGGGTVGESGIGVLAVGDVSIENSGTVEINDGIGILAVSGAPTSTLPYYGIPTGGAPSAVDEGTKVDSREGTVTSTNGPGIIAVTYGGDTTVDSGEVNAGSKGIQNPSQLLDVGDVDELPDSITTWSGGVIGIAEDGNATVTTHGKIAVAEGGIFGAAAITGGENGGNATVTVGADIDPPLIGASAIVFGSGDATVEIVDEVLVDGVLKGIVVEADEFGVLAAKLGDGEGDVLVNVGLGATIDAGEIGIAAANLDGEGDTTINVGSRASVVGGISAIVLGHAADGDAEINNDGLIQGNGIFAPVIAATTTAGLTINNNADGVIRGNLTADDHPLGAFESLIASSGSGETVVNNDGGMYGTVSLTTSGDGNVVNNDGFWRTGGFNMLMSGSVNDAINNTGTVEANALTLFVVDTFNNEDGLLTTEDDDIGEFTLVSGDFTGGGDSRLAFDTALTPGGTADLLVIGGDVAGMTSLIVNDLDGNPGSYTGNEDAVLFALVGGDTDVSNFTTSGGLDKGLFRYDAYLRNDPVNGFDANEWVLASTLDREAYEFPVITYGAQNLWHLSTGAWLDRTADLRATFGQPAPVVTAYWGDGSAPSAVATAKSGPGLWGRVFGGQSNRDMSNVSAPPSGLSGPTHVYDDRIGQSHLGFMTGVDFGTRSVNAAGRDQLWMFGLMGGYTSSALDFRTSGTDIDFTQGSVGAYATYVNGGLFVDAAVKADFGEIGYGFNDGSGFTDSFGARYRSVGLIVDGGYRMNVAGWFFEPKATLAWVNTSIDDRDVLGTGVSFDDGSSLRGRLGARVGTSIDSGSTRFEPFVEASVWNEFQGDYRAVLTSNSFQLPVSYDAGGVSGEVRAGASLAKLGGGWNAHGSGAARFGDNGFESVSGSVGLRLSW